MLDAQHGLLRRIEHDAGKEIDGSRRGFASDREGFVDVAGSAAWVRLPCWFEVGELLRLAVGHFSELPKTTDRGPRERPGH